MNSYTFHRLLCLAITFLVVVTLAAVPAHARTYYVNDEAHPATADGSRENPFPRIQDALDVAVYGDTIRVGPGIYFGQIRMKSGVKIYGGAWDPALGWPSTILNDYGVPATSTIVVAENIRSARLDGVAIINGGAHDAAGMKIVNSSVTVHGVSFDGNECGSDWGGDTGDGAALLIRGRERTATISECDFSMNRTEDGDGAGIAIFDADPNIRDCLFRGNEASNGAGGAIYANNSSPEITGCRFMPYTTVIGTEVTEHPNLARYGGAIASSNDSSPTILDCEFTKNRAKAWGDDGGHGGAVSIGRGSPTIRDCQFVDNDARYGGGISIGTGSPEIESCVFQANGAVMGAGGGIFHYYELWDEDDIPATPKILNSTFWNNTSGNGGGLMSKGDGADSEVINCTFYGNSSGFWGVEGGGAISCESGTDMTVRNSIFWANVGEGGHGQIKIEASTPTITYCSVEGGFAGATNAHLEPHFRDAAAGDFRLRDDSECIDGGDPDVTGLPSQDFEDDSRVIGDRVDIGIDEWHLPYALMDWELRWGDFYLELRVLWRYEWPPFD